MNFFLRWVLACWLWASLAAADTKPFQVRIAGKVLSFDKEWVKIANSNAKGKPLWVPRSAVVGEVAAGSRVVAVFSPDALKNNAEAMARLNSTSKSHLK